MQMNTDMALPKDPRAQLAIDRWNELKNDTHRRQWEQDAEEIARLMRPHRGGFSNHNPDTHHMVRPLSSEPIQANNSFSAGIYSSITNPASNWFHFGTPDPELNRWGPMTEWLDTVTQRVAKSFMPSVSPFYSQTYQGYADIAAFGNMANYDEIDLKRRRFRDVTHALTEVVADKDAFGQVNEIVRRFRLTARQAVEQYGLDGVPEPVRKAADKRSSDKFVFYHHVLTNLNYQKGKLGPAGKEWLSHHICEVDETLCRVNGYDEMPYYLPRWDVGSGHVMGVGPGWTALASASAHQLMDEATIRAAQRAADPTLLAPNRDVWAIGGVARPGGVLYGGMNIRGNRMVDTLNASPSIGLTDAEKRAKAEEVKEAFHYSIMGLVGRTGMTTEETQIIEQAKLRNWAPHADRIMEEYAAPKVERRFKQLWRAGQLPPPPPEARDMPLNANYTSMAQLAQRAREGQQVRTFIGDLTAMAQLSPRAAERYSDRINPDVLIETLHDAAVALPAKLLDPREVADQRAADRAQAQQAQQALVNAQQGGAALRDVAQAANALGGQ